MRKACGSGNGGAPCFALRSGTREAAMGAANVQVGLALRDQEESQARSGVCQFRQILLHVGRKKCLRSRVQVVVIFCCHARCPPRNNALTKKAGATRPAKKPRYAK